MKLPVYYNRIDAYERKKVREEYIKLQGGLCYWCQEPLESAPCKSVMDKKINKRMFPPSMFKYPIHLDHDHNTGLTRGAVHARCNAVMWQYYRK